jgi:hypothetical protein
VQHFGAGICAGALATLLTNPFDVVRTRMQLTSNTFPPNGQVTSSWGVAVNICAKEGWATLLVRGLLPRVYKKSLAGRRARVAGGNDKSLYVPDMRFCAPAPRIPFCFCLCVSVSLCV